MPRRPDYRGTDVPSIARRIILTRRALGWSQAEICRRTGLTTQAWNNYERALGRPDIDPAIAIVRATGVSLDWIYLGVEATLPAMVLDGIRRIEQDDESDDAKAAG
jgi:transcriptional regulator with XRE-family HTH domain